MHKYASSFSEISFMNYELAILVIFYINKIEDHKEMLNLLYYSALIRNESLSRMIDNDNDKGSYFLSLCSPVCILYRDSYEQMHFLYEFSNALIYLSLFLQN